MNSVKVNDNLFIGNNKLTLIGGPCTAESAELCCEVALFLKALCEKLSIQYVFKASFDKANRSSGASRRGPGLDEGLRIFREVKKQCDVPVITDVHESEEVARVAEVVDMLQQQTQKEVQHQLVCRVLLRSFR